MFVSWRGPVLACTAMTAVAAALLLASGHGEAGLEGYGDQLEDLDVQGFACVPATNDTGDEPRADIEWVRAARSSSNHLAPGGIVAHRATGSGNLHTDPRSATGGPGPSSTWFSLGPGGYLMGRMEAPVDEAPGVDLVVAEHVGLPDPFCVYGSLGPSGPWVFVGWWHGFDNQEVVAFDLGTHFVWQGKGTRLDHVLIVDAALQSHTHVDFVVVRSITTPANASGNEVRFRDQTLVRPVGSVSYHWDFGDGSTSTQQHPSHKYATPGVFQACLEVRLDGNPGDTRCKDVPVENRAPSAAAKGVWQDASSARFVDASTDEDGDILSRTWTLPDGSAASGPDTGIVQLPQGLDGSVCIAVQDDRGATAQRCYTLVELAGSAPVSRLADTLAVTGGQPLLLDLAVQDDDGHPFRCELLEGPPEAAVRPDCTLDWYPPGEGRTCFRLRFEDITTLSSERLLCLQASSSRGDTDRDGVADAADNCPGTPNRGQEDSDRDGIGDACQDEAPQPTAAASEGNLTTHGAYCPPGRDLDHDGIADDCDTDIDGDGVPQAGSFPPDNCPYTPNPDQVDTDRDGVGDACQEAAALMSEGRACTGRCGAVVMAGACDDCAPAPSLVGTGQLVWVGAAFAATVLALAGAVAFMTRRPKPGP